MFVLFRFLYNDPFASLVCVDCGTVVGAVVSVVGAVSAVIVAGVITVAFGFVLVAVAFVVAVAAAIAAVTAVVATYIVAAVAAVDTVIDSAVYHIVVMNTIIRVAGIIVSVAASRAGANAGVKNRRIVHFLLFSW